jgi:hypothetical protein
MPVEVISRVNELAFILEDDATYMLEALTSAKIITIISKKTIILLTKISIKMRKTFHFHSL